MLNASVARFSLYVLFGRMLTRSNKRQSGSSIELCEL
jgi:hypothetical protein